MWKNLKTYYMVKRRKYVTIYYFSTMTSLSCMNMLVGFCSGVSDPPLCWTSPPVKSELLTGMSSGDDDLHVAVRSRRPSSARVRPISCSKLIFKIGAASHPSDGPSVWLGPAWTSRGC